LQKFAAGEINRFVDQWEKAEQSRRMCRSRSSAIEQGMSIYMGE